MYAVSGLGLCWGIACVKTTLVVQGFRVTGVAQVLLAPVVVWRVSRGEHQGTSMVWSLPGVDEWAAAGPYGVMLLSHQQLLSQSAELSSAGPRTYM